MAAKELDLLWIMRVWTDYGGPLFRRKRKFTAAGGTSEKCQEETHAPQQNGVAIRSPANAADALFGKECEGLPTRPSGPAGRSLRAAAGATCTTPSQIV